MNNLLFIALLLALAWYFFYHLPNSKNTTPLTFSQSTQTEPNLEQKELEPLLDQLIQNINQLNQELNDT